MSICIKEISLDWWQVQETNQVFKFHNTKRSKNLWLKKDSKENFSFEKDMEILILQNQHDIGQSHHEAKKADYFF